MVTGDKIQFINHAPSHSGRDSLYGLDPDEIAAIDAEINMLEKQNVIKKSNYEQGEFISHIFTRQKSNGQKRMILSLKNLNAHCKYEKFKMAGFKSISHLITPNCWMASIDLTSAYYSVPIDRSHWKYLKFIWREQRYAFTVIPNGLPQGPRRFTKLTKPIYAYLHKLGHIVSGFLDDTIIIADSFTACVKSIADTVWVFQQLGFTINVEKSVLIPTQWLVYLGFAINSVNMSVSLPGDKRLTLKALCLKTLKEKGGTIREIASVIGSLVSTFPAMEYGPLHYRFLEHDKKEALKSSKGDWECHMTLTQESLNELSWWINNIGDCESPLSHGDPTMTITSDSSLSGWGAHCGQVSTGGQWSDNEQKRFHINCLEAMASFFALKTFAGDVRNAHVRLRLDNIPALKCINKMGSKNLNDLNEITQHIWHWCLERGIHISCAYIPGVENVIADRESRRVNTDTEWKLNTSLLAEALQILGLRPTVDLFASRLNHQFERYMSRRPDPHACVVDAFTVNWQNSVFYCFPPFSLIPRVLNKIKTDQATGILVVPAWPTQIFYPRLAAMLFKPPIILSARRNLLNLPSNPVAMHPLHKRLRLLVCAVSGKRSLTEGFQNKPQTSSWGRGEIQHAQHTHITSRNGDCMLSNGKWIYFVHL